jgi:predicted RNA-binding Zn-ribbon protein involved in translation (DUF1610 family)
MSQADEFKRFAAQREAEMKTQVFACPHCGMKGRNYRKQPTDYGMAQEWAEKLLKTHDQLACPGCGRYTVWRKRAKITV